MTSVMAIATEPTNIDNTINDAATMKRWKNMNAVFGCWTSTHSNEYSEANPGLKGCVELGS